jgi:hypothetical protein
MGAKVNTITAHSRDEMRQTAMSYIAQGYAVSIQDGTGTTLVKKKKFNIVWAVVGFFLSLLPLLIYLVVYALQRDEIVFISVVPMAQRSGGPLPVEQLTWSGDRRYWWDGKTWVDAEITPPEGALWGSSGTDWWDGTRWRRHRPLERDTPVDGSQA